VIFTVLRLILKWEYARWHNSSKLEEGEKEEEEEEEEEEEFNLCVYAFRYQTRMQNICSKMDIGQQKYNNTI
jgi:hypothetical protein